MPDLERVLEQDNWLRENTFWCPRLKCSMTPDKCRANRAKRSLRGKVDSDFYREHWYTTRPPACEDCTYYEALWATKGKGERMEDKGTKPATFICARCGEVKEKRLHFGRNLEIKCYFAARKDGTLENYPKLGPGNGKKSRPGGGQKEGESMDKKKKKKAVASTEKAPAVEVKKEAKVMPVIEDLPLDLSIVPGLNDYLIESAKENLRTLEDQVLFILKTDMVRTRTKPPVNPYLSSSNRDLS